MEGEIRLLEVYILCAVSVGCCTPCAEVENDVRHVLLIYGRVSDVFWEQEVVLHGECALLAGGAGSAGSAGGDALCVLLRILEAVEGEFIFHRSCWR